MKVMGEKLFEIKSSKFGKDYLPETIYLQMLVFAKFQV
jgi:hypothetical protein